MKLSATREQILAPLQSVIGVVERRQTMPVLSNVLLAARNNRISVTGTDL
jgi:DNA polymerase-3 subunit beta